MMIEDGLEALEAELGRTEQRRSQALRLGDDLSAEHHLHRIRILEEAIRYERLRRERRGLVLVRS